MKTLRTCNNPTCEAVTKKDSAGEIHVDLQDGRGLCPTCLLAISTTPGPAAPAPMKPPAPLKPPEGHNHHAAFILATNHRPKLLDLCLAQLVGQIVPDGWTYDVIVSGTNEDFGVTVARKHGAIWVQAESDLIGHKLKAAVATALGLGVDPIIWVGDDDLQSSTRLLHSVRAYERGARGSGVRGFWYLDTASGRIAWWEGGGRWYGAGVGLQAVLWRRISDWEIERGAEPWLYAETWAHPIDVEGHPEETALGLVCLQHGRNLTSRQFPQAGEVQWVGAFEVTGRGHISAPPEGFPDYPELRDLCREAGSL